MGYEGFDNCDIEVASRYFGLGYVRTLYNETKRSKWWSLR
jgi:hypothetical protein